MTTVLVTGGSGFIGAHCVLTLLDAGYKVRASLRGPEREAGLRALVPPDKQDDLTIALADLERDEGWGAAVAGCTTVLHVASPFPLARPRHEDDLVRPAREGTLRVLRAARAAGVRRVVVTSSFAAIGYGQPDRARPFDETDWTNVAGPDVQAYIKSKTLAERAAWDFVERDGTLELATVNPVGVFGPALNRDLSSSVEIIRTMMAGRMPVAPRIHLGLVDVRDVADLHVRAMTDPAAAGQRFLAVAGDSLSLLDIAAILRRHGGPAGRRAPRLELPDWTIRALSLVSAQVREAVPHLGRVRPATSDKARRLLGWAPRSNEEAVMASAESLVRLGLVKVG